MAPILTARGSADFPPADPEVVRGNTVPVPGCTSVSDCRAVLTDAGFRHATAQTDSSKPAGRWWAPARPVAAARCPGSWSRSW